MSADARADLVDFYKSHATGDHRQHSSMSDGQSTQHTLSVLLVVVVVLLHTQRLLSALTDPMYSGDHSAREILIAALGFGGAYLYWKDVSVDKHYDGILKLIAMIGVANLLVPCLWPTVPRKPPCIDESDDDVIMVTASKSSS